MKEKTGHAPTRFIMRLPSHLITRIIGVYFVAAIVFAMSTAVFAADSTGMDARAANINISPIEQSFRYISVSDGGTAFVLPAASDPAPDEGEPVSGDGTTDALPISAPLDRSGLTRTSSPLFTDSVGMLTPVETAELNSRLDELSTQYGFDVAAAIVQRLDDRSARLFAADYYEERGYGQGADRSGAILLLAMEDRDFGFAATGYGMEVFTPAGQEYLDSFFLPQFGEDRYFDGFMGYADGVEQCLIAAANGAPIDSGNIPMTSEGRISFTSVAIGAALLISFLIAFGVTSSWKRNLRSVKPQNLAHEYIREDSFILTDSRDDFLYRNVIAIPIPQNENRGGGGGIGGSFSSSSGGSFTGHSGKF
ncbi:MAG: TPM domain-containing protein [Clostridiales Family XIII bacterium]|jgi:uncharacterized protein|nr:TPM domain-containing protein [Clostridiales Family XIII bacterium]